MNDHHFANGADHGRLGRLGAFVHRHRGRVVLAWVAALVAVLALSPLLKGTFQADFATKGSESEQASTLLGSTSPVDRATRSASSGRRQVARRRRRPGRACSASWPRPSAWRASGPRARSASSPTARSPRPRWSSTAACGTCPTRPARSSSSSRALQRRRVDRRLGGGPIRMAEGGGGPEGFGLLGAALVLLIAFGSIVAAGLPLAVALFGLGISASLIGVLAAVMEVPDFATAIAGLLGIGVGIDYALLVLTRFRAGLDGGADVQGAIVEAVGTAGAACSWPAAPCSSRCSASSSWASATCRAWRSAPASRCSW